MAGLIILAALTLLFTGYLALESFLHNRRIRQIPVRITVSGTRGKTGIVRTLASVFRAAGYRTLAKTTGSEAMYILPDGTEDPVRRRGLISVLEQKTLVSKAVGMKADCLIAEVMSIQPENHTVESQRLLKPHLTILSNFRPDHTDAVGESAAEISGLFSRDILPGSVIIIPEKEVNPHITAAIGSKQAKLIIACDGISNDLIYKDKAPNNPIVPNLDTVLATARHFGIPDDITALGIATAKHDAGHPDIFPFTRNGHRIWFVNAFAANDPISTLHVIRHTLNSLNSLTPSLPHSLTIFGLLNLRSDRGERSQQWLTWLRNGGSSHFSRLYATGAHARIFERKLDNCTRMRTKDPAVITRQILESATCDTVVFGLANIHGPGFKLIEVWKELCDEV